MRSVELWQNKEFSDVTFRIKYDGSVCEFPGHRCIFGIMSPAFRAMLYGDWKESQNSVVTLEDIPLDAFMSIAKYLYTAEVDLKNVSHAINVYHASHKYLIDDFLKVVENYLIENVNETNVLEALECSTLYKNSELTEKCGDIIKLNTELILTSQEFENCDVKSLEFITGLDSMNISEVQLFNFVKRWADYNSREEGKTITDFRPWLSDVLRNIRFLGMSPSEFGEGPGECELLNESEQLNLLMNINTPGCRPLPEGFSTNKTARSNIMREVVNTDGKLIVHEKGLFEWWKYNVAAMFVGEEYNSPTITFNNFPFRFILKLNSDGHLYVGLCCDATVETHGEGWYYHLVWSLGFKSQKGGAEDYKLGFYGGERRFTFNESYRIDDYHYHSSNWSYLTDPKNGFIKNETLKFELRLQKA